MKKLVVFLLLGFASFALIAGNSSYAADELVDLYPYGSQACLEGTDECTNTKLGSSHWTMEYAGHRYHFVRDAARFTNEFVDEDSNGLITIAEMPVVAWNAFASIFINDTDVNTYLGTSSARTDLTTVVHRMYSYFDENGQLAMFEDHINAYYIFNDGTVEAPDWRMANEAEIDAFDAAEADEEVETPITTRNTHIRIALDDTDSDGYVVEPLGYLKWTNADVDTEAVTDVEEWSTIINAEGLFDGNPNSVIIPAGWTVVTWGTLDRGTSNLLTTEYIKSMPELILDETLDPMVTMYADQPAIFTGVAALDDDLVTDGVNIVVNYNAEFDLDPTVAAQWVDMFDEEGKVINLTEKIDYSATISQDGMDLETIDFVYDPLADAYTASAAVTTVDTSMFGAGYKVTWMATTPEGDESEISADVVVGVMPPTFSGVEDRFVNQNVPVELLEGITADDGYGNDKTMDIEVAYPDNFNMYNPFPGEYKIDLEFTHHVFIEGIDPFINLNGTIFEFDGSINEKITNFAEVIVVYTDVTNFQESTFGWTSSGVFIEVDGEGNVIRTINRHNWDLVDAEGLNEPANASDIFDDWVADLVLEEGGFLVTVGWKTDHYATAQALAFGDPVSYDLEYVADFNYDIVTKTSYMITVDDMTAPIAMVVNEDYSFYSGEFKNANKAILANVVAYDFTDAQEDLVMYVSDNGKINIFLPGTYEVEVTVEDLAGHTVVVAFDVTVLPGIPTKADIDKKIDNAIMYEIQALIDAKALTEADVKALIQANVLSEAAIQALIDASIVEEPETGCGSAINGGSAIFITFSLMLGASAVFFFRRKR